MWLLPLVLGFCDDEIAIGHPPDSYLGEILYSGELTTVRTTTRARLLPAFPRSAVCPGLLRQSRQVVHPVCLRYPRGINHVTQIVFRVHQHEGRMFGLTTTRNGNFRGHLRRLYFRFAARSHFSLRSSALGV